MIHSVRQLKALVQNQSNHDSRKAQIILRNYFMERFLERLSLSPYRDNFILKGGMLVSAMVGLDTRTTMDIDTTIKKLPLSAESIAPILNKIIAIPLKDAVGFSIKNIAEIMEDAEYTGIRVMLEATLDTMRTPLKLDISTGDAITPREVDYSFKLMFEDRSISVWAYNLETVLAEKLETILSRGTANTRLRDFYDLYILQTYPTLTINKTSFCDALRATAKKRGSEAMLLEGQLTLEEVRDSDAMRKLWSAYQNSFSYADALPWEMVMDAVFSLYHLFTANG